MKKVLEVRNLSKNYGKKGYETAVLKDISMDIYEGDFIAIMGPSGAGKTTFLNMLSTLDKPSSGKILLEGQDITALSNKELSLVRRDKIGFIFQEYNLLDNMTVQDNIALPLSLNGAPQREIIRKVQARAVDFGLESHLRKYPYQLSGGQKQRAASARALITKPPQREIIRKVQARAVDFGLESHLRKYPYQLSGGQKQRAASARALITKPRILFADEPTGALDSKSGKDLLGCLKNANEQENATILMVTHDGYTASYAKEVYFLKDGKIHSRLTQKDSRKAFFEEIMTMLAVMGGEGE